MAGGYGVDTLITAVQNQSGSATGWANAVANFVNAFKSDATSPAYPRPVVLKSGSSTVSRATSLTGGGITSYTDVDFDSGVTETLDSFGLIYIEGFYYVRNTPFEWDEIAIPTSINTRARRRFLIESSSSTALSYLEFIGSANRKRIRFGYYRYASGTLDRFTISAIRGV